MAALQPEAGTICSTTEENLPAIKRREKSPSYFDNQRPEIAMTAPIRERRKSRTCQRLDICLSEDVSEENAPLPSPTTPDRVRRRKRTRSPASHRRLNSSSILWSKGFCFWRTSERSAGRSHTMVVAIGKLLLGELAQRLSGTAHRVAAERRERQAGKPLQPGDVPVSVSARARRLRNAPFFHAAPTIR